MSQLTTSVPTTLETLYVPGTTTKAFLKSRDERHRRAHESRNPFLILADGHLCCSCSNALVRINGRDFECTACLRVTKVAYALNYARSAA